jgi:MFS family permease
MATKGHIKLSLIVGLISGLLGCLVLTGCANQSTLTINRPILGLFGNKEPNDCNTPVLQATGQAASTLATQISRQMQTAQGAVANMLEPSDKLFIGCFAVIILGIIFWGVTKSSWGWLPPLAGLIGIVLLALINTVATQFAVYAPWVVTVIGVGIGSLIVWKAIEYHQERDAERAKLTAEKQKNGSG